MKIRIHGNSIRIRLSKSEVAKLSKEGYLEERTNFGNSSFSYSIQKKDSIEELGAGYSQDKISMYVPEKFLTDWPGNEVIGIESNMQIDEGQTLYLLLEKDFKCLDNVLEDQSDNYENPNKTC